MWAGMNSCVAVYFTDIKNLVRGDSIRGNVIDANADILLIEQANIVAGDDLSDKSYFFSSICMNSKTKTKGFS